MGASLSFSVEIGVDVAGAISVRNNPLIHIVDNSPRTKQV